MNDVAKIQFDLPTHMLSVSQIAFQLRQSLIIKPIKRGQSLLLRFELPVNGIQGAAGS